MRLEWILFGTMIAAGTLARADELIAITWATDNTYVYSVDSATGDRHFLNTVGFGGFNALARHRSGALYGVDESANLIQIDADTGSGTWVATVELGEAVVNIPGLAFAADGTLYAINNTSPSDELYRIDLRTGSGTLIGPTGRGTIQSLACAPDHTLYAWDIYAGLFTLDPDTGLATAVATPPAQANIIQSLAFGPDGTLYGAQRELYIVDPSTGAATSIASLGSLDVRGFIFNIEPPLLVQLAREPTGFVLCWPTETNTVYQLQQRPVLGPAGNWANVGPASPGAGSPICVTNDTPTASLRFFRVMSRSNDLP